MTLSKRVVCAIDFNHKTLSAEKASVNWAQKTGAQLEFVHVNQTLASYFQWYTHTGIGIPPRLSNNIKEWTDAYSKELLHAHLQHLQMPNKESFLSTVLWGEPALALTEYVNQSKTVTNLLVLSKRRRTAAGEFFLGSVAHEVLEDSAVPALVLPDDESFSAWQPENLIVAVSLRSKSLDHLEAALGVAKTFGAKVKLINVVEPIVPYEPLNREFAGLVASEEVAAMEAAEYKAAQDKLAEMASKVDLGGVEVSQYCVRGNVVEVLSELMARKNHLLVIGKRSSHKPQRHTMGRTTGSIVRSAQFPILVIP